MGKDVQEIEGLKRQGLSIQAISELTGLDRKTVRKYLIRPHGLAANRSCEPEASKLDPFKPYLKEGLAAGVWECRRIAAGVAGARLQRQLHDSDGLAQAQRKSAHTVAVRRFETPPGKQAQVLGTLFRMHEEAFRQLDGVPEEILYDRMKKSMVRRSIAS